MNLPTASIIIPAYNEAGRIGQTLDALLRSAREGEFEVIVVANGCSDDTAGQARARSGVIVIESATGSKSNALNLGDAAATVFPRVYLDADVSMTTEDVRALVEAVAVEGAVVASPEVAFDLEGASAGVRAFYRCWRRLPYWRRAIGSGVYAVSRAGRGRWRAFPSITADDAFVRLSFAEGERVVVRGVRFVVRPPRDLRSLVRIKTRSRRGNMELAARHPELRREDGGANRWCIVGLLGRPWVWGDLAVYLGVCALTWAGARAKHVAGRHDVWERDESSRRPDAVAADRAIRAGGVA